LEDIKPIPWWVEARQEWLGVRVLAHNLGWIRAIQVGLDLKKRLRGGDPWSALPSPQTARDVQSRNQIAPAVVLYQILKDAGREEALALVERVVTQSATPWMQWAVGTIKEEAYFSMEDQEREAWFEEKTKGFFNMTLSARKTSSTGASFRVASCTFPGLCKEAGVPELAPVFCAVDSYYFGNVQRGVSLVRPSTLSGGQDHCDFSFTWLGQGTEQRSEEKREK
jgi:hypothetical protein